MASAESVPISSRSGRSKKCFHRLATLVECPPARPSSPHAQGPRPCNKIALLAEVRRRRGH
jgi:hypothetical protein